MPARAGWDWNPTTEHSYPPVEICVPEHAFQEQLAHGPALCSLALRQRENSLNLGVGN